VAEAEAVADRGEARHGARRFRARGAQRDRRARACGPPGLPVGAFEKATSGAASRPGDVLHALDGTTIEMVNTNAEGRLVLADCRAAQRVPSALVDVATLTCTALGFTYAALFVNNED